MAHQAGVEETIEALRDRYGTVAHALERMTFGEDASSQVHRAVAKTLRDVISDLYDVLVVARIATPKAPDVLADV